MDIQISSNLERLLFEVLDRDGAAVAELLGTFRSDGSVALPLDVMDRLRGEFDAGRLDDSAAAEVIETVNEEHDLLLDPHSAVGVGVARGFASRIPTPLVCMATAHPAKFPDAVFAASGVRPPLPAHLSDLFDLPERIEHAPAELSAVEAHVRRVLASGT
jgi:threonine synthase